MLAALSVSLVSRAPPDLPDTREAVDRRDRPDNPDRQESSESRVHLDLLDLAVCVGSLLSEPDIVFYHCVYLLT